MIRTHRVSRRIVCGMPLSCLFLGLFSGGISACQRDLVKPEVSGQIRLSRTADGRISLDLVDAGDAVRAVQVELVVDGARGFLLEDVRPAADVPLDTVRMVMRGANRAILFAGDKRGLMLRRSGGIASFVATPTSDSQDKTAARVFIQSAVAADKWGRSVDLSLGSAISVR